MKLKPLMLGGKSFVGARVSPSVEKAKAFLKKSASDKLFTVAMLVKSVGIGDQAVRKLIDPEYAYLWPFGSPQWYYGNPAAIKRLKAKAEAQRKSEGR